MENETSFSKVVRATEVLNKTFEGPNLTEVDYAVAFRRVPRQPLRILIGSFPDDPKY